MLAYVSTLLRDLCLYMKHWILDHAHPIPSGGITVYPGAKGSLQAAITLGVTSVVGIPGMGVSADVTEDDGDERTCVSIDGERRYGCFSVCRYLGRLWRLYPVTPETALTVDSLLDLLSTFNRPFMCEKMVHKDFILEHLVTYTEELDAGMEHGDYLGKMETVSLADIMWCSCFKHVLYTNDIHDDFYDKDKYPNFHTWWTNMMDNDTSADISLDEDKKDT